MPAGGLFSTVQDTAIYYQILLNGGELNGRHGGFSVGGAQTRVAFKNRAIAHFGK